LEKSIRKNGAIHAVLSDFDGMLAEEGWKQGLRVIADANKLDSDDFIHTAHDTIYDAGYILGKGSENDFWNALRVKTG
jgi:putative hydrolase of the HAD superfamily